MANVLIKHLEEKGAAHPDLEMLVNQWGFDKLLIPKALQNVGSIFPHYSRHDDSHSRQILINIERLLGENVALLSATDTWLILEAAFWHDIGMVVPHKDIEEALSTVEFLNFVETLKLSENNELSRFAKTFDPYNMSTCFSGADTPLEAISKFQQLIAEWFRRKHQSRSELIVDQPWITSGISSPRTELIPNRLFRILGRICHMHGLPFKELFSKGGLPFREAGVGHDDCHPRYVACLLRMGDLLDLDDNRFCPVMQRMAGEIRPASTKAHEDKHSSMRHIRVDRERIEVSAECTTIEGYLEAFKWFDWLKQEINDQMSNWQSIVPNRLLGLLPTLGEISVSLGGNLQVIKEGSRPQFSIDGVRAIKVLQGENLYSSKFASIRELLQNSVDATLLRLWLVRDKKNDIKVHENPFSPESVALITSSRVTIDLAETGVASEASNKSKWRVIIADSGTGISRDDLAYMLRIGGSQENINRQIAISSMPEWMKPSGAFGIGFQSVFMLCNNILVISKNIFDGQTLEINMYNPTGPKEGLVLVKILPHDVARPFGTTIQFDLEMDKFASGWTWSPDEKSITSEFIHALDPILDTHFPYDATTIADKINNFAQSSPITIDGSLKSSNPVKTIALGKKLGIYDEVKQLSFVKLDEHEVAICYDVSLYIKSSHKINSAYRGQSFENTVSFIPYAEIFINILSGKAGAWLTANRDRLNNSARKLFYKLVVEALEKQVIYDLDNREDTCVLQTENYTAYSRFLQGMALCCPGKWRTLADNFGDHWLNLYFFNSETDYRTFFKSAGGVVALAPSAGELPITGADFLVENSGRDLGLFIFLRGWLACKDTTVKVVTVSEADSGPLQVGPNPTPLQATQQYHHRQKKYRVFYELRKYEQEMYTDNALAACLTKAARTGSQNERYLMECTSDWETLALKDSVSIRATKLFDVPRITGVYMLLPFLFQRRNYRVTSNSDVITSLCSWLQPHLRTQSSLSDIRAAYERLIDDVDNRIMKNSEFWDTWKTAREL